MGILNVTPDSFFKDSRAVDEQSVASLVEQMLSEGALIIDVGGQSTRPGATLISEEEELKRVVPVVENIHRNFPDAILSVDTFYAAVAQQSLHAGAAIINDVSAGEADPAMIEVIAAAHAPFVAMHKQGMPHNMQQNPVYTNIVTDLIGYFSHKVKDLQQAGIVDIIIDPGFGFGKNLAHNTALMKGLDAFKIFGLPLLAGISRKSVVQKLLNVNTRDALNGTTALHMVALQKGAKILRAHDVKEACECIRVADAMGWC